MPIKVDVNIDMNRINSRINKARKPMANQFMLEAGKYVPKRNGTLRQSGQIINGGKSIQWNTPYAHYQYMGVSKLGKTDWTYTTPGTGPKWDERVKSDPQAMKNIADAFRRSF